MPAKSVDQATAAAMALKAKRGNMDKDKLKGAAKRMYKNMSKSELKEFAETDRKDLPEDKSKKKGKK